MTSPAERRKTNGFSKLGDVLVKRKYLTIAVWVILLLLAIPVVLNEGSVTSLQQGSSSGKDLESIQAGDIITAQFSKTVANSTLLIVVTGKNVSTPAAQSFISGAIDSLKSSPDVVGLSQETSVYSVLYTILNGTNGGAYKAYDSANQTVGLLYGVPALYLKVWQQSIAQTHNVTLSNQVAFEQTGATLSAMDPTAYRQFTSPYLDAFSSFWNNSWLDPSMANYSVIQRASAAVNQSGAAYIARQPPAARTFSIALTRSFSFGDFVQGTQNPSERLSVFAANFVSNSSGLSPRFVASAFSLGRNPSLGSLRSLAGNMVSNPGRYGTAPELQSLIASFVSSSRDTTLISLDLSRSLDKNVLAIRSIMQTLLTTSGSASGVQGVLVTGSDAINHDFGASTQDDLGLILPVTIILLIVATGLFFRSALTPFITLGSIGLALGIAQVFVVVVGTYVAKVDFSIPTILLTILIGVGTDYSVFIMARYREERVRGLSVNDAMVTSVTWAGESIVTSGATVVISFLALSLTSVVYLRTMGLVVGLGVLLALGVSLTLVPAIVAVTGGRTFWPNSGERFARYSASVRSKLELKRGYFSRSGAFSVRRSKALILIAVIVSIPTLYVYSITTPNYDLTSGAPSNLESIAASNQLTSSFGGGRLFPSYVVVTFSRPLVAGASFDSSEMGTVAQISASLTSQKDILEVRGPTTPFGSPVEYAALDPAKAKDAGVLGVIMQSIGKDNKTALITLTFRIDPYSSTAIDDANTVRTSLHQSFDRAAGLTGLYVGGASGSILDTKNVFDSQFDSVLPIVALGVALVLLVVLGSLFLPVFAVLSVLMSIVWTLAVTKIVFQATFNYGILFLVPLFLFVTLLGLGMDYNIFILTRIREEATKGETLNVAIVNAIEQTGGIITAAAVILAGSLGALMLSSNLLLKEIGFAFSFSILIDALIVRTYLVPAVMSLVGRWNWYNPIPYLNRSKELFNKKEQS